MNLLAAGVADGIEYTLPLAIFDAVPVILAAIAYTLVSRELTTSDARRRLALLGTVLVTLGGTAKVAWKITVAASGNDITWLDDLLFPLLSAGLPLLAGALAVRAGVRATVVGVVAVQVVLLGLVVGVSPAAARGLAIAVMTLATLWIAAGLIRRARGYGVRAAVPLVLVNVTVAFVLAGLARLEQTIALQWIEELLNAASQGCLLVAVVLLVRHRDTAAAPERTVASSRGLVRR